MYMYQIIGPRGSGKTNKLMQLAKDNDGILVCANPDAMRVKSYDYGLIGFDIISYTDYVKHRYDNHKPIFIDEIDTFVKSLGLNLNGYTLTIGDQYEI